MLCKGCCKFQISMIKFVTAKPILKTFKIILKNKTKTIHLLSLRSKCQSARTSSNWRTSTTWKAHKLTISRLLMHDSRRHNYRLVIQQCFIDDTLSHNIIQHRLKSLYVQIKPANHTECVNAPLLLDLHFLNANRVKTEEEAIGPCDSCTTSSIQWRGLPPLKNMKFKELLRFIWQTCLILCFVCTTRMCLC